MIRRVVLTIIACSVAALAAAAVPATTEVPAESPQARAARYYAEGLELPLMQLRRGALLLQICLRRLRTACSKQQRELAAKNHTLVLLDELTLFAPSRDADPAAGLTRAADLKQSIAATSDALLREANAYDRQLLARYGAALNTCPGDYDLETYNRSLDALTSVELREFQGMTEPDYASALIAIGETKAEAMKKLRDLPAADCTAIAELGQLMMELMNFKLQPWTHEERRIAEQYRPLDFNAPPKPPTDDAPPVGLAHSVAGNFITVVATELQLKAFPATAPRIKAIAEAEGIHEN